MGWQFRKSFRLGRGTRFNLGKRSASISTGVRGARLSSGSRGTFVTLGIPGTGISYRYKVGGGRRAASRAIGSEAGGSCIGSLVKLAVVGCIVVVAFALVRGPQTTPTVTRSTAQKNAAPGAGIRLEKSPATAPVASMAAREEPKPPADPNADARRKFRSVLSNGRQLAVAKIYPDARAQFQKIIGGAPGTDIAAEAQQELDSLAAVSPVEPVKEIRGNVVGVTDGGTIRVLDSAKTEFKVRLEGIDAPESGQPFGTQAKQALSYKIFGGNVVVKWKQRDEYDRILGDVFFGNRWINLELVREGMAWHYKQFSADPQLAKAETDARDVKVGLWVDARPTAPWEWRRTSHARKAVPVTAKSPAAEASESADSTNPDAPDAATGTTSSGRATYVGPRGGVYHYSKSGKKVYERHRK